MNLIDGLFQRLRSQGRRAFMPFLTAGDPSLSATAALIRELAGRGASLIEVGLPATDPIADGPTVQASYTRALAHGIRIDAIFDGLRETARSLAEQEIPLVGMISYTLVHRRGPENFVKQARAAGLSGAI